MNFKSTSTARRCVLALSIGFALSAPGFAVAQDQSTASSTDNVEQLQGVTVTGTRMKRVDQEDLQPLIVISRQQLDESGHTSIAEVLRDLTQNSFGPSTDRMPASSIPGSTTANLRGQGAQYTLVLLNGIPLVGEPSQAGGDVQNLNVLPWAAIDRIEILTDGASAVYGSKAIGGVINVITKQNYSGAAVSAQIDRPTQSGADSNTASFVAGFHHDDTQALLSVEYSKSDPLFSHERKFLPPQFSFDSAPPTWRRNDPTGIADQAWHPSANCPTAIGTDPRYPNSQLSPIFDDGSQFCMYNYVADAEEIAALERKSMMLQGSTKIADAFNVHALLLVSHNDSRGEIAAAPSGALTAVIPADSPFNPTLGEVAPGVGFPLDLRYRPTPNGHRIIDSTDDVQQLTAGIGGSRIGGWDADWNVDLTAAHYGQETDGRNFASVSAFMDAIANGTFNPFADPSTQDFSQFTTPIKNTASYRSQGVLAQIQPHSFSVLGIALDLLAGAEYKHETFAQFDDPKSVDGDIFGSFGTRAGGERNYHALFSELVLNPNGNWQVKAAVRRDDYSDAGGALSPKLSAMWKIADSFLVRASAGKGFHVPDLVSLGGSNQSFTGQLTDPLGCRLRPTDPIACGDIPRDILFITNPHLDPETARQINFGAVYSPSDEFSVGVEAFQTKFSDAITSIDQYIVLDNEVACYDAGRTCNLYREGLVERDASGEILRIIVPLTVNAASSMTRGYDVDIRAAHDFGFGVLDFQLAYSHLTSYEQRFPGGLVNAPLDYLGYPKDRTNAQLGWKRDAWHASIIAHMIGSQRNCDPFDNTSPTCAERVGRHTTLDVQAGWDATEKTTLTLGIRNLANSEPPLNYNGTYITSLYDAVGRVVYFRFDQRF